MPVVTIKDLKARLHAAYPRARLLGVDHGTKTLGLALSNPELSIATPFKTLAIKKFTENLRELAGLCQEYEIRGFVIGLPLNMDGSSGKRAEQVKSFGNNLMQNKAALGFDPLVCYWDERLSTSAAEDLLTDDLGIKHRDHKSMIDALAAQIILSDALRALAAVQASP